MTEYADTACQALLDKDFSLSVPWFLMAGYLYQYCDDSLLSDTFWNGMCRDMDTFWDAIEHHHKHLIFRDGLCTSSAMDYDEDHLPSRVVYAARHALKHHTGRTAVNQFSKYPTLHRRG